jgi:MFS family permease
MLAALRSAWPLFVGILLLMVGNGLLVTSLTLRGSGLGFGETAIGLMQAAYPVGTLVGCLVSPRLVARVGHVRVFAAFASVASTASLIHLVTDDPWSWGAIRALSGFCFAGLYVVAESWLNARATNAIRGSLLSVYFVTQAGGSAIGQLLLSLAPPETLLPWLLVSLLMSVALVPVMLSASAAPAYALPERISIAALYRISPMGLTGALLNGVAQGTVYISLALYGDAIGLASGEVGFLIGAATIGGVLLQFPLGRLSDRVDRRLVIAAVAALAVPLCLAFALGPTRGPALLYAGVGLLGGLTLPIYSLSVAHTNDQLTPGQIVAASGALVLVFGAGIIVGPIAGSLSIRSLGPGGVFLLIALVQGLTALIALLRVWRGAARPPAPMPAVPLAPGTTAEAARLNPEAARGPSRPTEY